MEFDSLENKFNIKYYNNMISYCKKLDKNYLPFQKILENINISDNTLTETDTNKITTDPVEDNCQPLSDNNEIKYSEDYLYKKQWSKLTNIHKIIKIKEFVNKLLINEEKDKDELKKTLIDMVKNKQLSKKEIVNYDSINGRIIAIIILEYKDGKYFIKSK